MPVVNLENRSRRACEAHAEHLVWIAERAIQAGVVSLCAAVGLMLKVFAEHGAEARAFRHIFEGFGLLAIACGLCGLILLFIWDRALKSAYEIFDELDASRVSDPSLPSD